MWKLISFWDLNQWLQCCKAGVQPLSQCKTLPWNIKYHNLPGVRLAIHSSNLGWVWTIHGQAERTMLIKQSTATVQPACPILFRLITLWLGANQPPRHSFSEGKRRWIYYFSTECTADTVPLQALCGRFTKLFENAHAVKCVNFTLIIQSCENKNPVYCICTQLDNLSENVYTIICVYSQIL